MKRVKQRVRTSFSVLYHIVMDFWSPMVITVREFFFFFLRYLLQQFASETYKPCTQWKVVDQKAYSITANECLRHNRVPRSSSAMQLLVVVCMLAYDILQVFHLYCILSLMWYLLLYNLIFDFSGGPHPYKAQYLRLTVETDPADIMHMFENVWNVPPPKLIITVHGGLTDFK